MSIRCLIHADPCLSADQAGGMPIHSSALLKWKGIPIYRNQSKISLKADENHNDYIEEKIEFIESLFHMF